MTALEALEQITFDEFLDLIAERVKEKADTYYTCFETVTGTPNEGTAWQEKP